MVEVQSRYVFRFFERKLNGQHKVLKLFKTKRNESCIKNEIPVLGIRVTVF